LVDEAEVENELFPKMLNNPNLVGLLSFVRSNELIYNLKIVDFIFAFYNNFGASFGVIADNSFT